MTHKLFTIIMATYNCGRKAENTLQSIFAQNEELFELLVFDSASTDDTLDSLKKYEHKMTLISEKDKGVYDAFNKGIERAKGEYIYFIGAGDCLRPDVLNQIKEYFPRKTPALIYGKYYLKRRQVYEGREIKAQKLVTNNICHQAIFYHRDIFKLSGNYDLRYKVFSDWVFNLKCFSNPEIDKLYIPCVVADFEEGGLSSNLKNDPEFVKDYPRIVRKHLGVWASIICKAFITNPALYNFLYNLGYKPLEFLFYLAKPFVRRYRQLAREQ